MKTPIAPLRLAFAIVASSFILHPSSFLLAQGPLTPPGAPAPTMKTLDQLDAKLEKRTPISSAPFTISASVTITGCTVYNNLDNGINIGAGIVSRCDVSANSLDGVRVGGSCRVTENRCDGNGVATIGSGIHVLGSACTIEKNSVASNDIGIDVDSAPQCGHWQQRPCEQHGQR